MSDPRRRSGVVALKDLVRCADEWLEPGRYEDYPGAVNGLQFENTGRVRRIGAAVDGTLTVATRAVAAGCDLLLVHHGLFWGKTTPWTGRRAELIRLLVGADMAVYSQHLPLDGHPRLGNAAGLARALGFRAWKPFFRRGEVHVGVRVRLARALPREDLAARLAAVLGDAPKILPGGPAVCREIGICTGGAGSELPQAAAEGVDTLITGEGPHWTFALSEDCGVNAFYGGHYATETFGVKALAEALSRRWGVPWEFIEHPTGL